MGRGLLILLGLGAVAFILAPKANAMLNSVLASITIKFKSIKILGPKLSDLLSSQPVQLELNFDVTNPTDIPFKFESFQGYAVYNGSSIGNVFNNTPQSFPGRSVKTLTVQATVNNSTQVLMELSNLILTGAAKAQSIRIIGTMRFNGINIPVDQSVPVSV